MPPFPTPHEIHRVEIPAPVTFAPEALQVARRVYLAGPMTGYPDHNYAAFADAALAIRGAGFEVYSPAEFDGGMWAKQPTAAFPVRRAFSAYTRFICEDADALIVLPGWENSRGAMAEVRLAVVIGIPVVSFTSWCVAGCPGPNGGWSK